MSGFEIPRPLQAELDLLRKPAREVAHQGSPEDCSALHLAGRLGLLKALCGKSGIDLRVPIAQLATALGQGQEFISRTWAAGLIEAACETARQLAEFEGEISAREGFAAEIDALDETALTALAEQLLGQ